MLNLIPYFPNSLEINGHKQGPNSGYKPGSVALYHCHEGFVLLPFSAGKRVCRKGKWEGTIPACGRSDLSFCTLIEKKIKLNDTIFVGAIIVTALSPKSIPISFWGYVGTWASVVDV